MLESQQLYYVGCKNDILPCVEDQLSEVPTLQRGVEVRPIYVVVKQCNYCCLRLKKVEEEEVNEEVEEVKVVKEEEMVEVMELQSFYDNLSLFQS